MEQAMTAQLAQGSRRRCEVMQLVEGGSRWGRKVADGNRQEEAPENTLGTGTQECRLDRRGGKGVKVWLEHVQQSQTRGDGSRGFEKPVRTLLQRGAERGLEMRAVPCPCLHFPQSGHL